MNRLSDKGTWVCAWCGTEVPHTSPWRAPLLVADGWPVGTGTVVCGPLCSEKPVGVSAYQNWGRGAA